MSGDTMMSSAVLLAASMDAFAALAAHARVQTEGIEVDPAVRATLAAIAGELLGDDGAVDPAVAAQVVGMARAFARQAVDLIDDPGRRGDWSVTDPALLQGLGRLSAAIAGAFRAAEAGLPGMAEALGRPGARVLDVGTGTGWLAIALAAAYPAAEVVGIDVFDTALDLARQNVAATGADRVDLRHEDVTALAGDADFDAIWLPLPFLPEAQLPAAVSACARALRPGGWLLAGAFAGPPDRLSQLMVELRTLRSGGKPWRPDELAQLFADTGLHDAHEVPRTWPAPVRLHVARRAPT